MQTTVCAHSATVTHTAFTNIYMHITVVLNAEGKLLQEKEEEQENRCALLYFGDSTAVFNTPAL